MSHEPARVGSLLLGLLLVGGCGDAPSDEGGGSMCAGDVAAIIEGELIEWVPVGAEFDDYCAGGFEIAESHARWVAQAWGTEPRAIKYVLFDSPDHPCWPCADEFAACAGGGDIAAASMPNRHELAHAVRPANCFPVIEEGWAMLYGVPFETALPIGDIRDVLADGTPGIAGSDYPLAARFVAFLLETRGVAKLRDLCALNMPGEGVFEAALLDTYGASFDELADEFGSYPEWSLGQLRQDQACESADVLAGTSWDFSFQCGAPDVEGRIGDELVTQRLIELPVEGIYQFIFESDIDLELRVELRSCAREGMASNFYYYTITHVYPGLPHSVLQFDPYPAGVYVLRVRVEEPAASLDLHISVAPWP